MSIQPSSALFQTGIAGIRRISPEAGLSRYRRAAAPDATPEAAAVQVRLRPETENPDLYGPDARLRGSAGPDEAGAEARRENLLARRDAEIRQRAGAQGEALDGREAYIYQTGPNGELYAVGRALQMVRRKEDNPTGAATGLGGLSLSAAEEDQLRRLQERDAKVRAHEAAHLAAAGGQAAGLPEYVLQTGPDGRAYAVGGSVNISITSTGEAGRDVRQAETAQRAALAAGEPSAADMQAARQASDLAARARQRGMEQYRTAPETPPLTDLVV